MLVIVMVLSGDLGLFMGLLWRVAFSLNLNIDGVCVIFAIGTTTFA